MKDLRERYFYQYNTNDPQKIKEMTKKEITRRIKNHCFRKWNQCPPNSPPPFDPRKGYRNNPLVIHTLQNIS